MPFDIPDNWTWIRLKSLANIYNGNSINEDEKKKKYTNVEGRDFIATKDVGFDRTISYKNGVNIPYELDSFKIAPANKILMCIEGGSAGRKIAITDRDVCFGNKLACFDTIVVNDNYLFNIFQSNEFTAIFKSSLTGIIGGVSINTLKEFVIPLPPLEEQQRIVDKINSFEPLLQEYDSYEKKLSKLEEEFPEKLKKSILQYAIEGKLVKQDPNDEPASVLLERIKAEKESLIKAGKIKRDKNESYIYQGDDKNYYENLPYGWCLCSLHEIVASIKAGGDKPSDFTKEKSTINQYPVIANGIQNDGIIGYSSNYVINYKSITISGRGTIGFPVIRNYEYTPVVRLLVLELLKNGPIDSILKYFLHLKCTQGVGTSIQQLTVPMIYNMKIELPPIEEQKRLSHKISVIFKAIG